MSDKILLTGISGWIAKHTAIELLGFKFKPAKDCMIENAKSIVRLGLV